MNSRSIAPALILLTLILSPSGPARADECVECHMYDNPGIVRDWRGSKHAESDVGCAECHEDQYRQFAAGKHSIAWQAMEVMPTTHYKPMELLRMHLEHRMKLDMTEIERMDRKLRQEK